jgi:hypothetical protein
MLGFALSPDGSKVYAGNVEQGLFVGARDGGAFANTSNIHVQCLATSGVQLWACSNEASGFIAGVSNDDGATFEAKVRLMAPPPIACAADAAATLVCGGEARQTFCQTLPGCAAGPTAPPAPAKACGCSVIGGAQGGAELAAASGAFVAMVWRRRRNARTGAR